MSLKYSRRVLPNQKHIGRLDEVLAEGRRTPEDFRLHGPNESNVKNFIRQAHDTEDWSDSTEEADDDPTNLGDIICMDDEDFCLLMLGRKECMVAKKRCGSYLSQC